jgi:hypothetical protein
MTSGTSRCSAAAAACTATTPATTPHWIFEAPEVNDTPHAGGAGRARTVRSARRRRNRHALDRRGRLQKVMNGQTTLEEVTRMVYLIEQQAGSAPARSVLSSTSHA